jgi:hypothetical protein
LRNHVHGIDLLEEVHRAADTALRELPGLVELEFELPPRFAAGSMRADVLVRVPTGPDREAAETAVMDAVLERLHSVGSIPGVAAIELEFGDL